MDPYLRLKAVRDNLALAVALWASARAKHITYRDVPSRANVPNDEGKIVEINSYLDLRNDSDLNRLLTNQVRAAFAFSCLNADEALTDQCGISPLEEPIPDLRAIRCVLYLLRRAVSRDLMQPVWDCPPEHQQKYQIRSLFFSLDAAAKHGQPVSWDDFGGMERYQALLQFCSDHLTEFKRGPVSSPEKAASPKAPDTLGGALPHLAAAAPAPAAPAHPLAAPGVSEFRENVAVSARPAPEPPAGVNSGPAPESPPGAAITLPPFSSGAVALNGAEEPSPADAGELVRAFVAERCVTGANARVLARQLYDAYLAWSAQHGKTQLVQRAFGMRLTDLGFTRRRRGRGRHWWEGVSLAHAPNGAALVSDEDDGEDDEEC